MNDYSGTLAVCLTMMFVAFLAATAASCEKSKAMRAVDATCEEVCGLREGVFVPHKGCRCWVRQWSHPEDSPTND